MKQLQWNSPLRQLIDVVRLSSDVETVLHTCAKFKLNSVKKGFGGKNIGNTFHSISENRRKKYE